MTDSFVYVVSPEHVDIHGHVTVPALFRYIMSAIGRNIRLDDRCRDMAKKFNRPWTLLNSAVEIDERPNAYDNINVFVAAGDESENKCSRTVRINDDEGREIARATTEWTIDESSDVKADGVHYINAFCDMLPKSVLADGLALKFDMDCAAAPAGEKAVLCDMQQLNDEEFSFTAKTDGETVCRASFTIE